MKNTFVKNNIFFWAFARLLRAITVEIRDWLKWDARTKQREITYLLIISIKHLKTSLCYIGFMLKVSLKGFDNQWYLLGWYFDFKCLRVSWNCWLIGVVQPNVEASIYQCCTLAWKPWLLIPWRLHSSQS